MFRCCWSIINIIEEPPSHIALGFAAFLLFMRAEKKEGWDDKAGYFADLWARYPAEDVVMKALGDKSLWGADLLVAEGDLRRRCGSSWIS